MHNPNKSTELDILKHVTRSRSGDRPAMYSQPARGPAPAAAPAHGATSRPSAARDATRRASHSPAGHTRINERIHAQK